MAFSLTAADPQDISEDGGQEIQIQGSFELQNRYKVHIGPLGTTVDPACHSGKVDQSTIIYPWTAGILRCYAPVLPVGSNYEVTVVNQDTAESHQLVNEIDVYPRQFKTSVYDLRKVLPNFYRTGPKKIDLEVAPNLDDLGMIEAITGLFGEELTEVGGFRMTRLAAAVAATDVSFPVESTLDWADIGRISVDGVPYNYSAKTLTTLTGIEHVAAGATVAGAAADHRDESAVVDLSREWSGLDLLRRAFLVDYAEGDDLNALGRNLGVNRLPLFTNDDDFRSVIKAVAYNPRGTVLGLELAMEAILGAGNYEVYEDLIQFPCTVFLRVNLAAFVGDTEIGKAFLSPADWDEVSGAQDTLVVGETPLAVGSVVLKDLNELFDFRNDKPSAVTMAPWPGETPITPWTYQGGEAEGAAVTQVPGSHTEFSSAVNTVYYQMSDVDGARLTDKSNANVSVLLNIPSTATIGGANREQCMLSLEDGTRSIQWGVLSGVGSNYIVGLFDAGGWLGTALSISGDVYHEITLIKNGDVDAELWIDGLLITRVAHNQFDASANHRAEFGILVTAAGLDIEYKQLGAYWYTVTDYWATRGTNGGVNVANPTRFDDSLGFLTAGDVGKYLTVDRGSATTNPQGGYNSGHFLIDSYVSPGVVELAGPVRAAGATISSLVRITVELEEEFTYPDDLGKQIVLSGSSLGNDGAYTIGSLIEPGTLVNFASYATPITGAKTNICEISGGALAEESGLDYQLLPVFVTEAVGILWVLSDASSFSGPTITLRSGMWINDLVMETRYTNVLSAQLLTDSNIDNTITTVGPPVEWGYYPFYLADPLAVVTGYVDDLTAAGVIPEFEIL